MLLLINYYFLYGLETHYRVGRCWVVLFLRFSEVFLLFPFTPSSPWLSKRSFEVEILSPRLQYSFCVQRSRWYFFFCFIQRGVFANPTEHEHLMNRFPALFFAISCSPRAPSLLVPSNQRTQTAHRLGESSKLFDIKTKSHQFVRPAGIGVFFGSLSTPVNEISIA